MGVALVLSTPRRLTFEEYSDPPLGPSQIRLRTLYSGISAGTELATYRGSNPHQRKRWNPDLHLFQETSVGAPSYPLRSWGYEQVGTVVEVGAEARGIDTGHMVWGMWGHRSTHVMDAAQAIRQRLPTQLDPVQGIFAHVGATALNGILDAQVHVGETVAVFGQGVVGLIVTQLAKLSGATVVAVERYLHRREAAVRSGADEVLDPDAGGVAERIRTLTGGRGADVCIEAAGNYAALAEAIRAAAPGSVVVALGFFQGEAAGLFLGEEFHHNRIT
ncbi:MAG: zinc-binding dehydrogenase, partial [Gemmatimonadales bacterium]